MAFSRDIGLCVLSATSKINMKMDETQPNPHPLQRNVILVLLLALAAAAWAVLVWEHSNSSMDMAMASPDIGLRAPLVLAMWVVVMMVAMMLPTATPMILAFHKVQAGKHHLGDAFVSTWVFVAAYLLVWVSVGFAAYAAVLAAEASVLRAASSTADVGGVILMAAGLYQLTPLKEACLAQCRAPMHFITTSWREGAAGAFQMGWLHGLYCLGCCWMLFVILFPLGMSVGAMAAVALIILAERTLPWPRFAPYAAAVVLVLYGALVIASPQFLPTFGTKMPAETDAEMKMEMPGRGNAPT